MQITTTLTTLTGLLRITKGCLFVRQLQYIVGERISGQGMKRYFNQWGFKTLLQMTSSELWKSKSGLELSWYLDLFIGTTQFTDYSIEEVNKAKRGWTSIHLKRNGQMPMPIDIHVKYDKDGNETIYHIPLTLMRGEKPAESNATRVVLSDWPWTNPDYSFEVDVKRKKITSIEIDPTQRLVDLNNLNGIYPFPKERKKK